MVETTGLDSRACGRLVARGHNSPPDCCSVPLVLRAPMQKKKRPPSDEGSRFLVETTGLDSRACGRLVARGRNSPPDCCSVPLVLRAPMQKKKRPPSDEDSRFLVETMGLDSRACGRLVARGRNSPPDCCSVPLVLRAPMQKKKRPPSDEGSRFLVETTGLEPVTSCV